MKSCDKCNGVIQEGAKFCPHCGDPVTEADLPIEEGGISQESLARIEFSRSTSASYEQAVGICKNVPSYAESGEDKTLSHSVELSLTEIELVIKIWELVGTWKSSRLLINGQPATKKDLVYKSLGCFRQRQKAYDREQYCFGEQQYDSNIWGCKFLGMPFHQWGGGWLEYGQLDKSGTWHFDKKRIRHELEQKMHEASLCPVLNKEQVLRTLENLPNKINPKKDPDWEYVTSYEDVSGDYKEVAVGIRPVVKRASRYVLGSYKPQWEFEDESRSTGEGSGAYTIEVDVAPRRNKKTQSKSGCMGVLVALTLGLSTCILMLAL